MSEIEELRKQVDQVRRQIWRLRALEHSRKTSPWRRRSLPREICALLKKKGELYKRIHEIEKGGSV